MMNIWFTADTHFGHRNVISYENRPFASTEEMDETMIENWNNTVHPNDLIFHLGDVHFLKASEADKLKVLNGRKILILGNHDRATKTHYNKLGYDVHNYYVFEDYLLSHHPQNKLALQELICQTNIKGNVHGHVHSNISHLDQIIYKCVSVELNNYKPFHLEEIREHFDI